MKPFRRLIVWMHRALRVEDNLPLWQAIHDADEIVPVIVLRDDRSVGENSPRRIFIRSAIAACDAALRRAGSRLVPLVGAPEIELPKALRIYGAEGIYAPELSDPVSRARDLRVAAAVERIGGRLVLHPDRLIRREGEVLSKDGRPYRVFTPFKRTWLSGVAEITPSLPAIRQVRSPAAAEGERALGRLPGFADVPKPGGAREGKRLLRRFLSGPITEYDIARDLPGANGTSGLSPYLAHGVISAREVYHSLREAMMSAPRRIRSGADSFLTELIWREFYYHLLHHFPAAATGPLRAEFATLRWENDPSRFAAWKDGRTGYPIVDAAMRQLAATGWMHNRTRMIVASFLTKHLRIDWRLGEEHFFHHLIDGDIASNNGGWQWCAGTGTDASPWFRIFNPMLQSRRFDPNGQYIRAWVDELADLPDRLLHEPGAGGNVAGYPRPIVTHPEARAAALAMYRGVT